MDSSLLELLHKVTLMDLIWALVLIAVIVGVIVSQKKNISKVLNKWRKNKNNEEDFTKLVYDLKKSVDDLKKEVSTYKDNRIHDREDSKEIQKQIYKDINKQSEGIMELKEIIVKMQEKNSKTKRAEIKEKIERIYRECNPTMSCTPTQLETLKELIEEYEAHGGNNSFVHTLVEPEMYGWEIKGV